MNSVDVSKGVLQHFPAGSGEKLEGKDVCLNGNYCHPKTGVG